MLTSNVIFCIDNTNTSWLHDVNIHLVTLRPKYCTDLASQTFVPIADSWNLLLHAIPEARTCRNQDSFRLVALSSNETLKKPWHQLCWRYFHLQTACCFFSSLKQFEVSADYILDIHSPPQGGNLQGNVFIYLISILMSYIFSILGMVGQCLSLKG